MALKRAARTSLLGLFAAVALAAAAGAEENQGQHAQQIQMQGPGANLLWLKPTAGQQTCPTGQALAVTTNAAGEQTSKPKCMPKPQGEHPN